MFECCLSLHSQHCTYCISPACEGSIAAWSSARFVLYGPPGIYAHRPRELQHKLLAVQQRIVGACMCVCSPCKTHRDTWQVTRMQRAKCAILLLLSLLLVLLLLLLMLILPWHLPRTWRWFLSSAAAAAMATAAKAPAEAAAVATVVVASCSKSGSSIIASSG